MHNKIFLNKTIPYLPYGSISYYNNNKNVKYVQGYYLIKRDIHTTLPYKITKEKPYLSIPENLEDSASVKVYIGKKAFLVKITKDKKPLIIELNKINYTHYRLVVNVVEINEENKIIKQYPEKYYYGFNNFYYILNEIELDMET
jgi:hypothetical protein